MRPEAGQKVSEDCFAVDTSAPADYRAHHTAEGDLCLLKPPWHWSPRRFIGSQCPAN